jgi:hypothetical protein
LSQYANDAQIVLGGSGNLIRNVKLLDSDTAIGGLKLNYNRSELAPLGKSKMEEIEIQRRAKDRQCNMA